MTIVLELRLELVPRSVLKLTARPTTALLGSIGTDEFLGTMFPSAWLGPSLFVTVSRLPNGALSGILQPFGCAMRFEIEKYPVLLPPGPLTLRN